MSRPARLNCSLADVDICGVTGNRPAHFTNRELSNITTQNTRIAMPTTKLFRLANPLPSTKMDTSAQMYGTDLFNFSRVTGKDVNAIVYEDARD